MPTNSKNILSSTARIQAPWVKVTIGSFTFGVYQSNSKKEKDKDGFFMANYVQYPNYVQSLSITKINGQVNQYSLSISYPVRPQDDPNFFEKVFSSVSSSRKIVFSYGDASMPSYCYKDEEAIITDIKQSFGFGSGNVSAVINYTISATSSCALSKSGCYTFTNNSAKKVKPSREIKNLFTNKSYGLQSLFTGMTVSKLDKFIAGDDAEVILETKVNVSALDYLNYLVSCMVPSGTATDGITSGIYMLTFHDDTVYDKLYSDIDIQGPYFKVEKTSYLMDQPDAYEVDIGVNTSTIVTNFSIDQQENYAMLYDYQNKLAPEQYVRRLNNKGQFEDIFAPTITSNNALFETRANDIAWWTKMTQYPIKASITIQGLLRPATLMQYLRLNVIFPGGHKHVASGLYIVTSQKDDINTSGYRTTLSLTKVSGDDKLSLKRV